MKYFSLIGIALLLAAPLGCAVIGASTAPTSVSIRVVDPEGNPVAGASVDGYGGGKTDKNGIWSTSFKAGSYWSAGLLTSRTTIATGRRVLLVSKTNHQLATVVIDFRREYDGELLLAELDPTIFRTVTLQPLVAQ
ncbi:MAG: hypothetical protein JWM57_2733 [Phycisphaerales bacterium]|nr:hypothetical protein [Phycisphaerales bacterium]